MSTAKSIKTELLAIYRLEFYKKQKNWKIATSRHDKSSKMKTNLNTTFSVPSRAELSSGKSSDPLNVAFIDSDSENSQMVETNELTQQWQEPVNIWPDHNPDPVSVYGEESVPIEMKDVDQNRSPEETNRNIPVQRYQECQWAEQIENYEYGDASPRVLGDPTMYHEEGGDMQDNVEEMEFECQENWAGSEAAGYEEEGYPEEYQTSHQASSVDPLPVLHEAQPGVPDYGEDWKSVSVDSLGEFMRGADAAPHSSEIDLSLPSPLDVADVSFTALSRLSSKQLLLAAKLHSTILRKLTAEYELRQRLGVQSLAAMSLSLNSSDERPTRDVGPDPGARPRDFVLAGSHRVEGARPRGRGRGRGRLPHYDN